MLQEGGSGPEKVEEIKRRLTKSSGGGGGGDDNETNHNPEGEPHFEYTTGQPISLHDLISDTPGLAEELDSVGFNPESCVIWMFGKPDALVVEFRFQSKNKDHLHHVSPNIVVSARVISSNPKLQPEPKWEKIPVVLYSIDTEVLEGFGLKEPSLLRLELMEVNIRIGGQRPIKKLSLEPQDREETFEYIKEKYTEDFE